MAEQKTGQKTGPENPQADPFALWRQYYEANEAAWTRAVKEMTTTPSFAEAQGKLLEIVLSSQKLLRDGIAAQLGSLNLPTRDDVARLGELILGLEEKVDALGDRLGAIEGRLAQRPTGQTPRQP